MRRRRGPNGYARCVPRSRAAFAYTCFNSDWFTVYFWSREDGEPIHLHVSEGVPSPHAAKFRVLEDAGVKAAGNLGGLSPKDVSRIQKAIMANHSLIVRQWVERSGYISFYGEGRESARRGKR